MNVTVNNEVNNTIYGPLELSEDLCLNDLKALLQFEASFDESKNELTYNNQVLEFSQHGDTTLKNLHIENNSILIIRKKKLDPIDQLRLKLLKEKDTPSILKDEMLIDLKTFKNFIEFIKYSPLSKTTPLVHILKNNTLLEESAYSMKIDEQMRIAMEYTPESFTTVSMLYINMEINGHPVKAFVDSGAQSTIMSTKLAKLTKLDKMVDKRFKGEARGVGVSNIIGRIHSTLVKIENKFVACSFTVLDINVDLLLGLDMLKMHQACIDLEKNVLRFANVETPFLGEADIPKDEIMAAAGAAAQAASNTLASTNANKRPVSGSQLQGDSKLPHKRDQSSASITESREHFPEESVKALMELGFSKDKVIQALSACDGNTEMAASLLYTM